jgi:hypothetical protein
MTVRYHVLNGCPPAPLAGYLKALGVLRLVGDGRELVVWDAVRPGHWTAGPGAAEMQVGRALLKNL